MNMNYFRSQKISAYATMSIELNRPLVPVVDLLYVHKSARYASNAPK